MDPDVSSKEAAPKEPTFREIFRHLFFKRFRINLFTLLLILAAIVGAAISLTGGSDVAKEQRECPIVNTTVCPVQNTTIAETVCPEIVCPVCPPTEQVIGYMVRCENGLIVNKSEECDQVPLEVNSAHVSTDNGITLSLDGIVYTLDNSSGEITQINYTVINKGGRAIKPKVGVKVYKEYTTDVKDGLPTRTFSADDVLDDNDGYRKSESLILKFDGKPQTIRLELYDTIPDPDVVITSVFWKFVE